MTKGYLSLILHAHLPFVRHPNHERVLEENWLYEAISETYLPLLRALVKLRDDGVPFRLTVSISPTLSTMLNDPLLQERYLGYVNRQIKIGEKEISRLRDQPRHLDLARRYHRRYCQNLNDFQDLYQGQILRGFKDLSRAGCLEIITTAATHCFLPFFEMYPRVISAQIEAGVIEHQYNFGQTCPGLWLPECGYFPGLADYLRQHRIDYFIAAANGLLYTDNPGCAGVYAPVRAPAGPVAFGADLRTAWSVVSSETGYVSDIAYRDFQKDISFEMPPPYAEDFIYSEGSRVGTGYKYWSRQGRFGQSMVYEYAAAQAKAAEHAENFVYLRDKQAGELAESIKQPPVMVCPLLMQIFGRWWFEGVDWLDMTIRRLAGQSSVKMITPGDYLKLHSHMTTSEPVYSSWGTAGYGQMWLDHKNDWLYMHLHKAIEKIEEMVERYPDEKGLRERVLNQAVRELLLSQASDWPFIMKSGATVPYAVQRVKEHLYNVNKIYDDLCWNNLHPDWINRLEKQNNIFPAFNYRTFKDSL